MSVKLHFLRWRRQYLEVIEVGNPLRRIYTNTGLDNISRWPEILALVTLFP